MCCYSIQPISSLTGNTNSFNVETQLKGYFDELKNLQISCCGAGIWVKSRLVLSALRIPSFYALPFSALITHFTFNLSNVVHSQIDCTLLIASPSDNTCLGQLCNVNTCHWLFLYFCCHTNILYKLSNVRS